MSTNAAPRVFSLEPLEFRALLSTYYVAPTGTDAANGSSAAPWQTLQNAADHVKAGDTVRVRAGTYAGFALGWNSPQNGTATAPISFIADRGVLINSANPFTPDGIDLEGSSFITVYGFTIRNSTDTIDRAGIRSVQNHNVIIRSNVVDRAGTWGIFTSFSQYVQVINNTTANSQTQHGIYISNSTNRPLISGNRVFGNYQCGIHLNGDKSQGGNGLITGAIIQNNVIFRNNTGGASAALNCDGLQNSRIQNNLLYDNYHGGIALFREDAAAPSRNNLVANNTVVSPTSDHWALIIRNGSTNNRIHNNIFYSSGPKRGSIMISVDSLAGLSSNYNIVVNIFSPNDEASLINLATWRAWTRQDTRSFFASPTSLFVNPARNDYRLRAASPAIGTGAASVASPTDIAGRTRRIASGRCDIGAYAYP